MATVIDALLVTLGLDNSGFKKGEKEVAQGQERIQKNAKKGAKEVDEAEKKLAQAQKLRAREMDQRSQQISRGLVKLRNEALGLLAVFTAGAGIKSFVSNTINTAAGLGFLSENLKKSTEDVQAWQRAAERMGGTAEGMTAQLKESASEIASLQNGMGPSEGMQWFLRMGGSAEALKDGNSYLLARADVIKKIFDSGDAAKAQLIANKMGISEDQYNLVKQGSTAILALVEAQKKNSAISAQDAKGALELRNRWLDFTQAMEATSTRMLVSLIPTFKQLMEWLQSVATWIDAHREDISKWVGEAVDKIIPLLQSLGAAIKGIDWKAVGENLRVVGSAFSFIADGIRSVIDLWNRLSGNPVLKFIMEKIYAATPVGMLGAIRQGLGAASEAASPNVPMGPVATPTQGTGGVIAQLVGLGWTQAQAAGLAANFMAESNLNPAAVGDGGKAYGIGQWHPNRQAAFKEKYGKDIRGSSLAEQVAFANHELTAGNERGAGAKLTEARTAAEAAAIASRYYERPADANGEAAKRATMAASIYAASQTANAVAAASMPTGAGAATRGVTGGWGPSTNSTDIKIGTIEINTKATDAAGIAKEIPGAITKHGFVNQANTGLS